MKTLLLIGSFLVLFSQFALADEWPYDPVCRNYNAKSETMTVTSFNGQTSKIVLCVFGVGSYIDADSIENSWGNYQSYAVFNYSLNTPDPYTEGCEHYGAWYSQGVDSQGRTYRLCEWGDRSIMEEVTFRNGPRSGWNNQMDWALGIYK